VLIEVETKSRRLWDCDSDVAVAAVFDEPFGNALDG